MNRYTHIYIFLYLELCLILHTILVSLISITPTHSASVRPGLEVFFFNSGKCQRNLVKEFGAYKHHHKAEVSYEFKGSKYAVQNCTFL